MSEIYVSADIEADGPIPGPNSMLSLGSAAFTDGKMIGSFSVNLETMEGATADPKTAEWWKSQPEAWAACRENMIAPKEAMERYHGWLKSIGKKLVFVSYPATYDFLFTYWYLIKFVGDSPFGFSGLDIKTYAMCLLDKNFKDSTKRNMPSSWFGTSPHTHKAVDDAIEQGELFNNMLDYRRNLIKQIG